MRLPLAAFGLALLGVVAGRRAGAAPPASIVEVKNPSRSNVKSYGPLSEKTVLEIHQTDGGGSDQASGWAGIKTNIGIGNNGTVFLVHPLNADIVKNYSQLIHIEVGGKFPALLTDADGPYYAQGRKFDRTHKKRLGEAQRRGIATAFAYIRQAFRDAKLPLPMVVGHMQTYSQRTFDPGAELYRYAISLAKRMGFPYDHDFTMGSGIPAHKEWRT